MSYDIRLIHPVTRKIIEFGSAHQTRGGTFAVGGTREAWLNVTYNYWSHFAKTLDSEKGIRAIYGLTGAESIPILEKAIAQLGDDVDDDYWKPTGGNAKAALLGLKAFAQMRPDGIWEGD